MSHAIFGYPHGDTLNSYYDREAREERYQAGREQQQRVGEGESRSKGIAITLPTEGELHQSFSERAIDLPTVAELEREAERVARVGGFHGWLAEKAIELGLYRKG